MDIDANFFIDPTSRPAFADLLRPAGRWFGSASAKVWASQLSAIRRANGSEGDAAARLTDLIASALDARADRDPGGFDPWTLAFGLTTVLTVERTTGRPCTGLDPRWTDGSPNLLALLAMLLDHLYHRDAATEPAGPLGFLWLIEGIATGLPETLDLAGPAVRAYAQSHADWLGGRAVAVPSSGPEPRPRRSPRRNWRKQVARWVLNGPSIPRPNGRLESPDRVLGYLGDVARTAR